MAVLVGLSVALKMLQYLPIMQFFFLFVAFPIILAGFMLGPRAGFWVGAISDILGYALFPGGPYFPPLTITQGLTGCLPAVIVRWLWKDKPLSFSRLLVAIAISQLLTKGLMVPLCLHVLYRPTPHWFYSCCLYAAASLPAQAFHVPLYAWLINYILQTTKQAKTI